jgi:hypothetical protein
MHFSDGKPASQEMMRCIASLTVIHGDISVISLSDAESNNCFMFCVLIELASASIF